MISLISSSDNRLPVDAFLSACATETATSNLVLSLIRFFSFSQGGGGLFLSMVVFISIHNALDLTRITTNSIDLEGELTLPPPDLGPFLMGYKSHYGESLWLISRPLTIHINDIFF
jgi:hypothetical protein